MKHLLLCLVLFSFALCLHSQTPDISLFARPNTVWSVGNFSSIDPPDYPWCVHYFKLCETLSENNVYPMRGGWSTDGYSLGNIDESPILFNVRITEDSLLYFEYPDENPALIFDYKARVGDTITLDGFLENMYSVYKIVVCDLDTIENEGNQYKMWTIAPAYVEYVNGNVEWVGGCSANYCSSVWFSGIGSECGFISEYNIYPLPGWTGGWEEVLCVWHSGSMIFHNASQYNPNYNYSAYYPRDYCTMEEVEALTGNKTFATENISISPNPATDRVSIEYDENELVFAGIFDILGNQIYVLMQNNELDLSVLLSGVYFLKFVANGKIVVEKIIKI